MLCLLGTIWCLPITVICLMGYVFPMWALGGLRLQKCPRAGVLHFKVPEGHWHNKLWRGFTGLAMPNCVLTRKDFPTTLPHELRHVEQQWALGPLYPLAYMMFHAAFGYYNNPFEVDARDAEVEWDEKR